MFQAEATSRFAQAAFHTIGFTPVAQVLYQVGQVLYQVPQVLYQVAQVFYQVVQVLLSGSSSTRPGN